jgi:hypothetical protein
MATSRTATDSSVSSIMTTKQYLTNISFTILKCLLGNYDSEDIIPLKYDIIKPKFFGQDQFPRGAPGQTQALAAQPQVLGNYETMILHWEGIQEFKQAELYKKTTENTCQANIKKYNVP